MKKFLVLIISLLMVSSSLAFSLDDLVGKVSAFNEKPKVSLDSPSQDHVYSGNIIKIKWNFQDKDGDTQEAYLIEISEDYGFSAPEYIGGTENIQEKNVKIRKGEGEYWVRVRVKDKYVWSDVSDSRGFYLDLSSKGCMDGTKFWECSDDSPNYCDAGVLIEDCSECGCPINSICQPSGRCLPLKCADRTGYSECSKNKPSFCQAGTLMDVCSLCGCPSGKECQSNGSCEVSIIVEKVESKPLTLLERVAVFFKSLFT